MEATVNPQEAQPREGIAETLQMTPQEREIIYAKAVRRANTKLGLYIHTLVYVVVILFLLAINLTTTPHVLWIVWPVVGWGAGLAVHWFSVLKLVPVYGSMKEREIARQLEIRQR